MLKVIAVVAGLHNGIVNIGSYITDPADDLWIDLLQTGEVHRYKGLELFRGKFRQRLCRFFFLCRVRPGGGDGADLVALNLCPELLISVGRRLVFYHVVDELIPAEQEDSAKQAEEAQDHDFSRGFFSCRSFPVSPLVSASFCKEEKSIDISGFGGSAGVSGRGFGPVVPAASAEFSRSAVITLLWAIAPKRQTSIHIPPYIIKVVIISALLKGERYFVIQGNIP